MTAIKLGDCKKQTGYELVDLLSLSGIFGIYNQNTFLELLDAGKLKCKIKLNSNREPILQINDTPDIKELAVLVRSPDELFIEIFRKEPSSKSPNVGFRRLISQVNAATALGFKRIRLWAYGNIKEYSDWDGYIVWGKYGFLMHRPDDISKFNLKMSEDLLLHCAIIYDLVKTKEGTAYWKYRGDSWYGELDLAINTQHFIANIL